MIAIGNFFFKYRNFLFIFLYLALFIPSPRIFTESALGADYYLYPLILGLFVTIFGQLIRGVTIALAYIVRGGSDKKVYVENLVTEGIFNHCRNPLYVGNILMLVGVGILINSLIFLLIFIPLFLFIYQAIVLADEILVQVSYAIGVAKPMGVYINTYGTAKVDKTDGEIAKIVESIFDLRPYFIEQRLKLRNPIYSETAAYGHMGRKPEVVTKTFRTPYGEEKSVTVELFTWEKLDYVEQVKSAFAL
jgi:hypothetical protein